MRTSPKLKKCHLWGNTCFPANFPFSVFFYKNFKTCSWSLRRQAQPARSLNVKGRNQRINFPKQNIKTQVGWSEITESSKGLSERQQKYLDIFTPSRACKNTRVEVSTCSQRREESGIFRSGARFSPTSGNGTVVAWSQPGKPTKTVVRHKSVIKVLFLSLPI